MSEESLFKFAGSESSVIAIVVAGDKEFGFFAGGEDTDGRKTVSQFSNAD